MSSHSDKTSSQSTRRFVIVLPANARGLLSVLHRASVLILLLMADGGHLLAMPDLDGDGFVGNKDFVIFVSCLIGPQQSISPECTAPVDADNDLDADLVDFAIMQIAVGHLPIPLRDTLGTVISINSTVPYSGRQTCGGCHDVSMIANGMKFQQGRTDLKGNIIVHDDYFGDGRWWQQSPSRYGLFSSSSTWHGLASKNNSSASEMNVSTFGWVGACGGCHAGGGPGEFDRNGMRLYDAATGKFGYELLGQSPQNVRYDGDYAFQPETLQGTLTAARWDVTGLSEPDCLLCHTPDPDWNNGQNVNRRTWRSAVLSAFTDLVDNNGIQVPAFSAAGPAGQGWFSKLTMVGGLATKLQLDYSVGVNRGTLLEGPDHIVALANTAVDYPPRDNACWGCHGPIGFLESRGSTWFDDRDVHYRHFNRMNDADPSNDITAARSAVCVVCHPGQLDHNFAKGNSISKHWRDELDYVNMKTCRDCHLTILPNGDPNPTKYPDAPDVPGNVTVHNIGFFEGENGPMKVLSCQFCHIPYPLVNPARAFGDATMTGARIKHMTNEFYSADPLDPSNPDKSRWYPGAQWKKDKDGVYRVFPTNWWFHLYWADWDQNGTPEDLTDDAVVPIPMWKLLQATGGQPLPGITDDTGDGIKEINRPEEILAYIQLLKGADQYGQPIAQRPVYVKTTRMWYEDPSSPNGVSYLEPEGTGMAIDDWKSDVYGLDHNVLNKKLAWGHDDPKNPDDGCRHCHRPDTLDSPIMDRLILIDPWNPDGKPVYKSIRQLTGLNPP